MYESTSQEKKVILENEYRLPLPQSLRKDDFFRRIGYCKGQLNFFKSDICAEEKSYWEK